MPTLNSNSVKEMFPDWAEIKPGMWSVYSKCLTYFEVDCYDKTGTHEYVIVRITRNTARECEEELEGQLSDGLFENSRTGMIEEVF